MSDRPLRIVAVGDLMLGDSPITVGFGFRARHNLAGASAALNGLRPALSDGDIVFGNLETVLSDRGLVRNDWRSSQLRGDPAYASVLRDAGFTIVSVANNHAAQHGLAAFEDSLQALRGVGITPCGVRGTGPWASTPVSLELRGMRIGVMGYCLRPRQFGNAEPPYAEGTLESIVADVERLRKEVSVVVVSLHWGEEFVQAPSTKEVSLGRSLIDAGATVVVGHHPHVVRPVERYRDGVIAYSLGNCVSDMVWYQPFRRGAVLSVDIIDGSMRAAMVRPTRLDSTYRAALAGQAEPAIAADALVPLSETAYAKAIDDTWRSQRLAAYRYVLMRVWRFPPKTLFQLVARTARNKIMAFRRAGSRIR